MSLVIGVAVAGAIGAAARYGIDLAVMSRRDKPFPLGIFVVNATGALALGVVVGAVRSHGLGSAPSTVLGTGLCGAFSTFSTFSFDTVRLLRGGEAMAAVLNVGASVVVGLLAAPLGLTMMAAI